MQIGRRAVVSGWSLAASLAFCLFVQPVRAADAAEECDVLVYGATPAGFCAAIGAAREGSSVILLEPTSHVGGVNTGGLCFSDSNQTVRAALGGLFEEWHLRIEKDYVDRGVKLPYSVDVKDHTHWTYEPHVAARVTRQMLDDAGVRVVTKQPLQEVEKDGSRITELTTASGNRYQARVFVDATYEGDLMAAAGVDWTIGREGRSEFGESLAGKRYSKPEMAISGYADDGELLPLITTADGGAEDAGDKNVMVYSFRLCLTRDPANRVPFPAPTHYDPARFEVVRRYYETTKRPVLLWDLYPLPGDKFDANNGIGKQFSMGLVGAGNGWSEASIERRAELFEKYKQYTLEMYHFLTTDPAVPETLRKELGSLGLCRDEFPENGHWSPQLYVREGRRMRGMVVLTQKDVQIEREKPDGIGISSFPIDSHDCQRIARRDGGVINEGTIFPVRLPGRRHGPASQVPYRAILPKPEDCTNLLVPVALSATHVAFSSIRVEPTWMTLGHSAGIAASLAASRNSTVQALPYDSLRERLLAQHQILDLPVLPPPPEPPISIDPGTLEGIVLDDEDADLAGHWGRSSLFQPHIGRGYLHDDRRGDGQSTATFRFTAPKAGRYELRLAYSAHPTRATNVPIRVTSGERQSELLADQTQALPKGKPFRRIAEVDLVGDVASTITISNAKTDGFVILDAVQLVPRPR
ncbi:MAG: FAD-dependent oxidoreductase [Planctomycetaceae bacterium]